ncbi:putative integral membrane protein [Brugia pahangi]
MHETLKKEKNFHEEMSIEMEKHTNKHFRMKEFQERPSLLTILLTQRDLSCLKNFLRAMFFPLFLKQYLKIAYLTGIQWIIYDCLQFWSKILCKTEPMKDFIFLFFLYVIYLCALFYCCFRFALMMQLEFRMHLYSNLRKYRHFNKSSFFHT